MLKNIQNSLLLRHPLLWNLKVVPLLLIMLGLHIIFFIWGYINGAIDFTYYNNLSYDSTPGLATFLSIFIGILLAVIWLVFYFRNNAFKSFYPKSAASLYKEWLILVAICIFNFSYIFSFLYAHDLRARHYFSKEELGRRLDIISMASLFTDGSFQEGELVYVERNGQDIQVRRDSFEYYYNKRKYSLKSLINKGIADFSLQGGEKDSLNELRVKKWLINDRKDSVLWVMQEFDKIAKEHQAKANITPQQWLGHVYNAPEFTKYITIGREDEYPWHEEQVPHTTYREYEAVTVEAPVEAEVIDTVSNNIKFINGVRYVYPKYYVPMRQMEDAYAEVSEAWTNPDASVEAFLFIACSAFAVSLLIFSFRVTSGRDWLIAAISFGVTSMFSGIITLLVFKVIMYDRYGRSVIEDYFYFVLWLVITAILTVYFYSGRKSKGRTGIVLNLLLWLLPLVLPTICFIMAEYLERGAEMRNGERITPVSWFEEFVLHQPELFITLCLIIFTIFMYLFVKSIRKWRGLPEA